MPLGYLKMTREVLQQSSDVTVMWTCVNNQGQHVQTNNTQREGFWNVSIAACSDFSPVVSDQIWCCSKKMQHVPFIFCKNPVVDWNRSTLLQYLSWAQLNFVVAAVHVMLWLPIMCFSDLANYTTQCPVVGLVRLITWYPSAAPPCRLCCSSACGLNAAKPAVKNWNSLCKASDCRVLKCHRQRTETDVMHFNMKTRRQEKRKRAI